MTIPLSSEAVEEFTPDSFRNLATPPVFLMKPITGADLPKLRRAAAVAGLRQVDEQDLRVEIRRCLREGWSDEIHDTQIERLEAFWDMADQRIEIPADELAAYAKLVDDIDRAFPSYRTLAADHDAFMAQYPVLVLAHALQGWRGLDAAFARAAGVVSDESLVAMQNALAAVEGAGIENKVEGVIKGIGFVELVTKALTMIRLPGQASKNFESPSPEPSARNGSTVTARPSRTASKSRAKTGKRSTRPGATSS